LPKRQIIAVVSSLELIRGIGQVVKFSLFVRLTVTYRATDAAGKKQLFAVSKVGLSQESDVIETSNPVIVD